MNKLDTRTVLVADDEAGIRNLLARVLGREGYHVLLAENGREAFEKAQEEQPDLVLLDLRMPQMDGLEALQQLRQTLPQLPAIMLTAHSTVESAVEAMKLGAVDYLKKPFDVEELKLVLRNALNHADLEREVKGLRKEVRNKYTLEQIIGQDPQMLAILEQIKTVAPTRSTVLICGESGTGKELIARAIHYLSPRADRPFVKVNCAALSEGLLESELYGHEKGAFTGAIRTHIGRFEQAQGGSILLDEIAEMSPGLQAKLLRVLQEKELNRVGGRESIPVDVRVMVTTNRDLHKLIKEQRFREDLFYRLNVVRIAFPPLRERKNDIPLLAEHFLRRYGEETNKRLEGLEPAALEALLAYDWPGNVRELENAIERAVVFSRGLKLTLADLPPELSGRPAAGHSGEAMPLGLPLAEVERRLILATLRRTNGNRNQTAEMLGISVRTLRNKLAEYREAQTAEEFA